MVDHGQTADRRKASRNFRSRLSLKWSVARKKFILRCLRRWYFCRFYCHGAACVSIINKPCHCVWRDSNVFSSLNDVIRNYPSLSRHFSIVLLCYTIFNNIGRKNCSRCLLLNNFISIYISSKALQVTQNYGKVNTKGINKNWQINHRSLSDSSLYHSCSCHNTIQKREILPSSLWKNFQRYRVAIIFNDVRHCLPCSCLRFPDNRGETRGSGTPETVAESSAVSSWLVGVSSAQLSSAHCFTIPVTTVLRHGDPLRGYLPR